MACAAGSDGFDSGPVLAMVDLDGDGSLERVRVAPSAGGGCPAFLGAATTTGLFTAPLSADEPPVSKAFGVRLEGRPGQLLVTQQTHPRGGFQTRVYAASGGELTELTDGGRSLVPFVATDVQEHPTSIDCADGRIVVTEAVAHQPAGVMFAWDVERTTYTLDGTAVSAGGRQEIADNVLPAQLKQKWPELAKNAVFPGCRT